MTKSPDTRSYRCPTSLLAGLSALLLVGACSNPANVGADGPLEDSRPAQVEAVAPEALPLPEPDCLVTIWDRQDTPDRDFDRANDRVEGGEISCATRTSASQYEAALAAIRDAAAGSDRAAMLRELNVPLLFITSDGERREVLEDDLADAGYDEVFSPDMLAVMRGLRLEDMTVVEGQGGFFELGSIWLRPRADGQRPALVTINAQALAEARLAASRGNSANVNR